MNTNNESYDKISGILNNGGNILIDTNYILANLSLPALINDLSIAELKEKYTAKDIPVFIKSTLENLTHDNFSIADPGQNWQSTDVIVEKLPARQLIYLGIGKNITLITFLKGGVGESEHILIIKYEGQRIIDFWCGNILSRVDNKADIIKYLKKNQDKKLGLNTNIINF